MAFPVPNEARRLWDEWNLCSAVLVSLFLQVVLIILANTRKRTGSGLLRALIWSFYLLADWIAAFAIGLISSGQTNDCPGQFTVHKDLAAFWAPFLLLHLGGPDAITAFSLEDNELWIRHLLGLVLQLLAVVYVFSQSLPNEFWIPTVLMFFAGICKFAERTRALYQGCMGNFKSSLLPKPDSGPNYAQLMEEYSAVEAAQVPVQIKVEKEPEKGSTAILLPESSSEEALAYMDIVLNGYNFFNIFKGLIVDHMFSFHERNESRTFFFRRTPVDAFKVMEVELNFMYDALYTKMAVVHCKMGFFLRFVCTALIVVCFQQFVSLPKGSMGLKDKLVTYSLLGGAVCLDFVALLNIVFSDWTIVSAKHMVSAVLIKTPFCRRYRRWSNSISQHSFINFCLYERFRWLDAIADFLGLKDLLDKFRYMDNVTCEEDLKEFLFKELKDKAQKAQTTKEAKAIYSGRGDWVLLSYPSHYPYPSILSSVSPEESEFDESILLWHVATELCYFTSNGEIENQNYRKFCKVLSDYMLYLLVMRPTLMSAVAGIAQIRFQDTCEEAEKFFKRWPSELGPSNDQRHTSACQRLLNVKRVGKLKPNDVKGDRSKSLLFDACILADDLNKLGDSRRWEMMSKIWVELLSYAASHCRPNGHAQQLSKGGELITFVWLQMAHFGLGEQFRIEAGHARAKLLVGK